VGDTGRSAALRGFGQLEAQIMDRVWAAHGPVTVRMVFEDIAADRQIAYTTVLTVFDKLHRKGWLTRELVDRAYLYTVVRSRETYSADLMREALSESHDSTGTLVAFLDQLTVAEARHLRAALIDITAARPVPKRPRKRTTS
jgi:predicted transcriptional regulator